MEKPPALRAEYGEVIRLAQDMKSKTFCVFASYSQAKYFQQLLKSFGKRGQVQRFNGEIRVWRMK